MTDIILPELGEGITDVEISDILVNVGDNIKANEPIIVLETEKASMEIPTTKSGIIETIFVKKGDVISIGKALLSIKTVESTIQEQRPVIKEYDELEKEEKKRKPKEYKPITQDQKIENDFSET